MAFSELTIFDTEMPVDAGLFSRNPNRVLRYGPPVDSFFGGDRRGVERPVFSSNASNDSTKNIIRIL